MSALYAGSPPHWHSAGVFVRIGDAALTQPWPPGQALRLGAPIARGRFGTMPALAHAMPPANARKAGFARQNLRLVSNNVVALPRGSAAIPAPPLVPEPPITLPSSGAQLVRSLRRSAGRGRSVTFKTPIAPPHVQMIFGEMHHAWEPARTTRLLPAISTLLMVAVVGTAAFIGLRHLVPMLQTKWLTIAEGLTLSLS